MFRLNVFVLLVALVVGSVPNAKASEHVENTGGLLSKHLYGTTSSFSRGGDTKSWSGGVSQGGWASIHPNINIGFSADYTLVSSGGGDSYEFQVGTNMLAHFLPDNTIDPFVQVGAGYATDQLSLPEVSAFIIGINSGVEIRASDIVSIFPSIQYDYNRVNFVTGDESAGYISPGFDVAIRLGRDSRIWLSPGVSYDLKVHGDDNRFQDVFTFSLSMLVEL